MPEMIASNTTQAPVGTVCVEGHPVVTITEYWGEIDGTSEQVIYYKAGQPCGHAVGDRAGPIPTPPELQPHFANLKARDDATVNLRGAATTLRQWSTDIRNSPAATTGNIVNQFQQLKDRQATFYERFADLLTAQGR